MSARYTYSDVKKFIEENSDCKLLTSEIDYKNTHQKLYIKCSCGNCFYTSFNEFKGTLKGENTRKCKLCINKQRRLSHLTPYSKLMKIAQDLDCEIITSEKEWIEYGKSTYNLNVKCSCGNIFRSSLSELVKKNPRNKCPDCVKRNNLIEKQNKEFPIIKEYVESNNEILLSSQNEYINSESRLKIMCPKGHIRKQTWSKYFHRGQRCPICNKWHVYTYSEVEEYLSELGLTLLTEEKDYKNCKGKLNIQCENGHQFEQSFDAIKNAHCVCPECSMSFGERKLLNILRDKNICFKTQYAFNDCKSDRNIKLRFDFAILKNDKVTNLIEVNGQQHYSSIDLWGGGEKLKIQQRNDNIKEEFCKNNNIPLTIIPYWEIDNMEEIIDNIA